jgi:hypothetical protein
MKMVSLKLYLFSNEIVAWILIFLRKHSDERISIRQVILVTKANILKQVKKWVIWTGFLRASC